MLSKISVWGHLIEEKKLAAIEPKSFESNHKKQSKAELRKAD